MKTFDLLKDKPEEIINELAYFSYCHNRQLGCTVRGLQLMGFPKHYEARYQQEKENKKYEIELGTLEGRKN